MEMTIWTKVDVIVPGGGGRFSSLRRSVQGRDVEGRRCLRTPVMTRRLHSGAASYRTFWASRWRIDLHYHARRWGEPEYLVGDWSIEFD